MAVTNRGATQGGHPKRRPRSQSQGLLKRLEQEQTDRPCGCSRQPDGPLCPQHLQVRPLAERQLRAYRQRQAETRKREDQP